MIKELLFMVLASAGMGAIRHADSNPKTEDKVITTGMPTANANVKRYLNAKIKPARLNEIKSVAKKMLANKSRYDEVEEETGVPSMAVIAEIHYREADLNFKVHLHEGSSPLTGRTKLVPKGYPKTHAPPFTWFESACDALKLDGLTNVKTWDLAHILDMEEKYNGWGYRNRNLASCYVFGATSAQQKGKFTSDHGFDPNQWDGQLGTAVFLLYFESTGIIKLDKVRKISL